MKNILRDDALPAKPIVEWENSVDDGGGGGSINLQSEPKSVVRRGRAYGDCPDQAARRGAAVKLNGGLKGRNGGNPVRGRRSRATRSVALYDPADPSPTNGTLFDLTSRGA